MKKVIINGKVWHNEKLQDLSILIDHNGRIAELFDRDDSSLIPEIEIFDAKGHFVLPGCVDMHTHVQDGAETFYPGSCAAAAGGVTTLVDMPPFHGCINYVSCSERKQTAERACVIDFMLAGGIVVSQSDLEKLPEVKKMGVPFFKVFMPADPPVDSALLWDCIQMAAKTGLRMAIHAEEVACLHNHVDWNNPLGFAHARPIVAETSASAQVLEMAYAAGAPVHICHVSAGRTADLIDYYKNRGTDVTAETTPHFLLFDETDFMHYGSSVKTTPPLRRKEDKEILWQALSSGVIDNVVSDHFLDELPQKGGRELSIKEKGPGIAGLEFSMVLLYDAGLKIGKLSLRRLVEITSSRPAEILGIGSKKGSIEIGLDADLIFLDPQSEWIVSSLGLFSRATMTPYLERKLQGRITNTFVRGNLVWDYEKGIIVNQGNGKYLTFYSTN